MVRRFLCFGIISFFGIILFLFFFFGDGCSFMGNWIKNPMTPCWSRGKARVERINSWSKRRSSSSEFRELRASAAERHRISLPQPRCRMADDGGWGMCVGTDWVSHGPLCRALLDPRGESKSYASRRAGALVDGHPYKVH